MAWVKIKSSDGEFLVPESLYDTLYKNMEAFSLVEESKPPINSNNVVEVKNDTNVQKSIGDERNPNRKSTKKIIK